MARLARKQPFSVAAFFLGLVIVHATSPAFATVRFGRNVYVGGHNFSNQTYDRTHRAVIHLSDRKPRGEGCRWRSDGRGGRVKICHLRRIRSH